MTMMASKKLDQNKDIPLRERHIEKFSFKEGLSLLT